MKTLILYWFKWQAAKSAKRILVKDFSREEIKQILKRYWERYLTLKPDVPALPSLGGSIMVHLAALSTATYLELTSRGIDEKKATEMFYEIAWRIYQKMGMITWCALDFPLAELWDGKLERTATIAEGAEVCDFKFVSNSPNEFSTG